MTDFNIQIATANGTGSMTANKFLVRCLIAEGYNITSKNLFPSNIAGLPTTFKIRISNYQRSSINNRTDIYVGFNKQTLEEDLSFLLKDTFCILNEDFKINSSFENKTLIPCRKLARELHDSASTKKLLYNMFYVGSCLSLTGCNLKTALDIAKNYFSKLPDDALTANLKALETGYTLIDAPSFDLGKKTPSTTCLFEGNTCSALGFLDGGATVATWYPITPSSSVAESFEKLSSTYLAKHRSVLQCEDEIASAVAALGAGWSGARSFTATSGPGLSLMQEAIGLGYFTESPFVILDVQRAGPSTGLPTRTAQGDLLLAHFSSHGDTIHPVLLPGTPQESYDDAFESLNLSQELQTPVLIMSDLDLGMNEWPSKPLVQKQISLNDGQVKIKAQENFKRFSNQSDVAPRSLPRLSDSSLAYFTRGSGHGEDGAYSEKPDVYENKLKRLKDKVLKSKKLSYYPEDIIEDNCTEVSIVTWGSTGQIKEELTDLLPFKFSYMRIRSLPLEQKQYDFLNKHKVNFVIEQNRDGQLNKIIKAFSKDGENVNTKSICQFNGLPVNAKKIALQILEAKNG